jgi:hypothetical protein
MKIAKHGLPSLLNRSKLNDNRDFSRKTNTVKMKVVDQGMIRNNHL